MAIESEYLYSPRSPEMGEVAKKQTLAQWRSDGKGPPYIKSGSRVLYRGQDVIDWLNKNRTVPPTA